MKEYFAGVDAKAEMEKIAFSEPFKSELENIKKIVGNRPRNRSRNEHACKVAFSFLKLVEAYKEEGNDDNAKLVQDLAADIGVKLDRRRLFERLERAAYNI